MTDRRSTVLVDHIGAFAHRVRAAKVAASFAVDAIVVLPEHLDAILTLPEGDAD